MANEENIRKVINWIKEDSQKFAMARFMDAVDREASLKAGDSHRAAWPYEFVVDRISECNTAFCIAGYANYLRLGHQAKHLSGSALRAEVSDAHAAAIFLDVDRDLANALFLMDDSQFEFDEGRMCFDNLPQDIRVKTAVNVLEHLIKTDEVDWDLAYEKAINS